jgi:hypothetical protein
VSWRAADLAVRCIRVLHVFRVEGLGLGDNALVSFAQVGTTLWTDVEDDVRATLSNAQWDVQGRADL